MQHGRFIAVSKQLLAAINSPRKKNMKKWTARLNASTPLILFTGIKNKPPAQHKQSADNQLFFNILLYTSNKEK
jgi:hypothetical protein